MKTKWSFSILIAILALLVGHLERTTVPNQEIVFGFDTNQTTNEEVKHAIEVVKNQLLKVGVSQIQVQEPSNGKLKIVYYSKVDVAEVKEILSSSKELFFNYNYLAKQSKSNKNSSNNPSNTAYPFNVLTIRDNVDVKKLEGYITIFKPISYYDGSSPALLHTSGFNIRRQNGIVEIAFLTYFSPALAIAANLESIPEVRAGPYNTVG